MCADEYWEQRQGPGNNDNQNINTRGRGENNYPGRSNFYKRGGEGNDYQNQRGGRGYEGMGGPNKFGMGNWEREHGEKHNPWLENEQRDSRAPILNNLPTFPRGPTSPPEPTGYNERMIGRNSTQGSGYAPVNSNTGQFTSTRNPNFGWPDAQQKNLPLHQHQPNPHNTFSNPLPIHTEKRPWEANENAHDSYRAYKQEGSSRPDGEEKGRASRGGNTRGFGSREKTFDRGQTSPQQTPPGLLGDGQSRQVWQPNPIQPPQPPNYQPFLPAPSLPQPPPPYTFDRNLALNPHYAPQGRAQSRPPVPPQPPFQPIAPPPSFPNMIQLPLGPPKMRADFNQINEYLHTSPVISYNPSSNQAPPVPPPRPMEGPPPRDYPLQAPIPPPGLPPFSLSFPPFPPLPTTPYPPLGPVTNQQPPIDIQPPPPIGERKDDEKIVPRPPLPRLPHVQKTWGSGSVNNYHIIEKIGEGMYGHVYKAISQKTKEVVALKRIRLEINHLGFPLTAIREIKLLRHLHHDNIITLIDMVSGQIDNEWETKGAQDSGGNALEVFMVFGYMDHDLTGLLESGEIKLTENQCRHLMRQILQGLAYCHANKILHRDIKGSNILLNSSGQLKLADFGLARTYVDEERGYTNRVITMWYRPPELLLGEDYYGCGVDIWSAGCILGELFFQKPIFQGRDEANQLELICKVCGTPREKDWPGVFNLPFAKQLLPKAIFRRQLQQNFSSFMPHDSLTLMETLLTMDPRGRPSAQAALAHPYFSNGGPPEPLDLRSGNDYHEYKTRLMKTQRIEPHQAPQPPIKSVPQDSQEGGRQDKRDVRDARDIKQGYSTIGGTRDHSTNVSYHNLDDRPAVIHREGPSWSNR